MLLGLGTSGFGCFEPGDVGVNGVIRGIDSGAGRCGDQVDVGLFGGVGDGGGEEIEVYLLGFLRHDE